ncbi:MAG: methyl-accepting chemotaxis protein [Brevinematales bacterium]|nr:methyl-accepting chemotaxis protein [Brevinematales bacterium]
MKASIKKKLWIFSGAYFFLTAILIIVVIGQYWYDLNRDVQETKKNLYEKYDQMIRYQVQTAHSLLNAIHTRVLSGELTEAQGRKLAADLLRDLRYGDNGREYFWADDLQGNNVVLYGRKDVEGSNRNNLRDARGTYIIQELRKLALQGGGYLDYYFPRQGETNPLPKRGYSKLFEPYGWVLGTGLYVDDIEASIAEASQHSLSTQKNLLVQLTIFGVLILLLVIVIQRLIHSQITSPLIAMSNEAKKIGNGNFDVTIDPQWQKLGGEIEKLSEAFHTLYTYISQREKEIIAMSEADFTLDITPVSEADRLGLALKTLHQNLSRLIQEVRNTVEQFTIGAEQLSRASQTLSQGSSEQASSIEEITSALTEINAQVKQNADKASKARDLSQEVLSMAENSQHSMQNLVEVMKHLNSSATEINNIVRTIDDIAFQINLLALNANVEAARAGKYGKGFAVVADEVRNLAVKSANSVKETTNKVRDIVGFITRGHEVTSEVASHIERMYTNMHQTIEVAEEVAASSQEQLLSMEQINQGIHQINQVTQTTASSAEETASAAEELASQATVLKKLVTQFKLSQGHESLTPTSLSSSQTTAFASQKSSQEFSTPPEPKKRVIRLDDDDFGKF